MSTPPPLLPHHVEVDLARQHEDLLTSNSGGRFGERLQNSIFVYREFARRHRLRDRGNLVHTARDPKRLSIGGEGRHIVRITDIPPDNRFHKDGGQAVLKVRPLLTDGDESSWPRFWNKHGLPMAEFWGQETIPVIHPDGTAVLNNDGTPVEMICSLVRYLPNQRTLEQAWPTATTDARLRAMREATSFIAPFHKVPVPKGSGHPWWTDTQQDWFKENVVPTLNAEYGWKVPPRFYEAARRLDHPRRAAPLHGDYAKSNVLVPNDNTVDLLDRSHWTLIDNQSQIFGPPEFDLGTMAWHITRDAPQDARVVAFHSQATNPELNEGGVGLVCAYIHLTEIADRLKWRERNPLTISEQERANQKFQYGNVLLEESVNLIFNTLSRNGRPLSSNTIGLSSN